MNKLFYIIAAGPSYMDVTEEEWKHLESKHTIAFARVPYGSRKTEYYFSIERDYLDKSVLTYMAKIGHLNTKLLLSIPQSIKLARELGFKGVRKIIKRTFYFMPSRKPWFTDELEPPHSFYECRAKNFHQPLFRFRGSLTAVINACLILGATEIRLIGVDLNNQLNFYQYPEYLKKVCRDKETIDDYLRFDNVSHKECMIEKTKTYPSFNPDTMHTTNMPCYEKERWGNRQLRGITDLLEWMDREIRDEGIDGIFITNKNSLLYRENKLKYKKIIDGIN